VMSQINFALEFLECPNCQKSLQNFENELVCTECSSKFKIIDDNIIDLVSEKSNFFVNNNSSYYKKFYHEQKTQGFSNEEYGKPGISFKAPFSEHKRIGFIYSAVNFIKYLLQDQIVFDIGAGRGEYSLLISKFSKFVFHCDLDLSAIKVAQNEADKLGIKNIIFIRCDYFFLPFKPKSIPCSIVFGCFYRGKEFDLRLLKQISEKLKPGGIFIADFMSKERSQLFNVGNKDLKYLKTELVSLITSFQFLLLKTGGISYMIIPERFNIFVRSLPYSIYLLIDSMSKIFFPPARWLILCKKK